MLAGKYTLISLSITVLLSLIACTHTAEDFPAEFKIDNCTELLRLPVDAVGTVGDLVVSGENLIVYSAYGGNGYLFKVYDIRERELAAQWGMKGRGSGEFMMISGPVSVKGDSLIFMDIFRKNVNIVSLDSVISDADVKITQLQYPYKTDFRPMRMIPVDTVLVFTGTFSDSRLGVMDYDGTIFGVDVQYPFEYEEVDDIYMGSVFQPLMGTDYGNRFVISTLASDEFEIYNIEGGSVSLVYENSRTAVMPQLHVKPRGNQKYAIDYDRSIGGYMDITADGSHIFMTYSDENYTDAVNSGSETEIIHCYDWAGSKTARLILPVAVSRISVSGGLLYGIRDDIEDVVVYCFKLPDLSRFY